MKLQIYAVTTGRGCLFEVLDSVKKYVKVPYELCVWYHTLNKGDKLDLDYFNHIQQYTDDVIMCTKNQGVPAAYGFGNIYKKYDYFLSLEDDLVLKEGAMEKMFNVFKLLDRVGYVGEGVESHNMPYTYEISNPDNIPDWGGIYNHEMFNEIGTRAAFFPAYGFDALELWLRMFATNWRIVNYQGLFIHGGKDKKNHETANKMDDYKMIHGESFGKLRICTQMKFKNYHWWSDKV